jgi:hypothetical protein
VKAVSETTAKAALQAYKNQQQIPAHVYIFMIVGVGVGCSYL